MSLQILTPATHLTLVALFWFKQKIGLSTDQAHLQFGTAQGSFFHTCASCCFLCLNISSAVLKWDGATRVTVAKDTLVHCHF